MNDDQFKEHWNTADPLTYSGLNDKHKEMRDNMTLAESVLWQQIKSNKLGVKFRRQHVIANYIADFVSLSNKLIIEVDGDIHKQQQKEDEYRTLKLNAIGYKVIRFTNEEVLYEIDIVLNKIKREIKTSTL